MILLKSECLIFFVLASVLVPSGRAQFVQQGPKLVGVGTVSTFTGEGSVVALSGDGNTAAITANTENAIWVFTRTNGVWSQQGARLRMLGCSGPASPGCSVALSGDGNTLIGGSPFDNGGIGSAAVYVRGDNADWSRQADRLIGNDAVGPAQQGYGVAISADGNTALVGGPLDANGMGATWVYTRDAEGVWSQQGPKLVGTGAVGPAWQGNSVALSADGITALSGGPFDSAFGGATWVFQRQANGSWIQQGPKLVGTGAVGPAFQGQSVSISAGGNTALVGGPQDNTNNRASVGAAWVFQRGAGGAWTQQGGKLVGNDFVSYPRQGQSVSLSGSGDTAIVGGPFDDGGKGAVWVYTRAANGVWTQQGHKLTGAGAIGVAAAFGQSAAISQDGTTILSGGPGDNADLGAAWVFGQARLQIATPAAAAAGVPFNTTVSVLDANGAPFAGYNATLHFTSTDNAAVLPPDTAFVSGGGNFAAILNTAGNQTITVIDTANPSIRGTSSSIAVAPGPAPVTHFAVLAPTSAASGAAFDFTVTALNAFNQPVASYRGPVRFASTDGAATLPGSAQLANGMATFPATLRTAGAQTISVSDTANPQLTGTSNAIAVLTESAAPLPLAVAPAFGTGSTSTFHFQFYDPRGVPDLGVVNILINTVLDGRHACYLAFSRPLNVLFLLDNNGAITPQGTESPNHGTLTNSQCTVTRRLSAAASPTTLDLALDIAFQPGFAGRKTVYLAARDVAENNSGWQPLGVWRVPGPGPAITTSVLGMDPARGSGLGTVPFAFGFADTKGIQDLGVVNILMNDVLDGRHACYLAYVRSTNLLFLVNDNGNALLPGMSMATPGNLANSQCAVSWEAGAVLADANNLVLFLDIAFRASFAGNRIVYLAARDVNDANNTDWQPTGTWAVQ